MKRVMLIGCVLTALCMVGDVRAEEAQFKDGQWVQSAAAGDDSAEGELATIRQLLLEGRPRKALGKARRFCRDHRSDPGAEEAMNLAGAAQMQRGRWWQAYEWFEQQLDRYPTGSLYERALVREVAVGEAFLAGEKKLLWGFLPLGAEQEGLDILRKVADRLPGSSLAERALMAVGDHFAANERWDEAAEAYKQYGEMFRGRYRSTQAELKAARTTRNQFAGTDWEDTALLESEQLFQAYLKRYPNSDAAGAVATELTEIERTRAQKDYETAEFYSRIGRPQSARFYHRQVVALYPQTTWAARSAEVLNRAAEASEVAASEQDDSE